MRKRPEAEDALRFYAELQEQTSVAACSELFRDAVARFGIKAFACGEIDLDDRDRNVMFIAEWPKPWLRYYMKSGFIKRDPIVNAVTLYRKPFTFGDIVCDPRFSSLEREAVRAAVENGWTQGLAVPVARCGPRFGLVTLIGRGAEMDPSLRVHLCLISESLLTRVRSLVHATEAEYAMPPAGLSKREVAAARLVALGHSDPEIAAELAIRVHRPQACRECAKAPEGEKPGAHGGALRVPGDRRGDLIGQMLAATFMAYSGHFQLTRDMQRSSCGRNWRSRAAVGHERYDGGPSVLEW